ncbi:MAG: LPD38 domain-containing protein, partial [Smithella sp.]
LREKIARGVWDEYKSKWNTSGEFDPSDRQFFSRSDLESYAIRKNIDFDYARGNYNAAVNAFGRAGFLGQPIPEWRVGWRYGKIPLDERSNNYREQIRERGVSLMDLFDHNFTAGEETKIYEMFNAKKDTRIVGGYYIGRGTDGEPLLVGTKDLTKTDLPNPTRPPEVGGQEQYSLIQDPLATHWETLENTKWDTMLYNLADKNIDAKDVVSAIRKFTSKEISETADAKLKETLYSGRLDARVKEFMKAEFEPVMIAIAKAKLSRETFEEYLLMRHAIEANDYYRRNKGVQDGGSGVLDQEARDYFKTLDPSQNRQMQPIAEMIDKITHKSAQTLIEYGVESNNTIGAWFGSYEHYVPLSRDDDPVNGRVRQTGFSVSGSSSARRQGGSDKPALNILANIAAQREKYIKRGEKNIIAKALYGLAQSNPNPEFWEVAKPEVRPAHNVATGELVPILDESYKKEDMVIMSRQIGPDGEVIERGIRFNEKNARAARMALAMKNLDMDSIGAVLGTMAKVTRYMASINTQYNPVFGITNFFRDLGTMAFNLSTTPISGKQAQVLKGIGPALMGISKALRGDFTSEQSKLFKEFQMHGGQTGYVDLYKTAEDRTDAIDKQLKLIEGKNPIRGLISWAGDALSNYNTSIENAVRLSAYEVGIANGMSKDKAAAMAKDLTVNFNRKGQWASQAGAMYAFFNASVQGTMRMYETFTGPKGKKIIAGGIIFGAVQALALAAAGFGDDEPPDFVRERNIIIPIGGKKYVTIPMPLGFNVLPNIGRIPVEIALTGGRGADKKIASMLGVILETFNPMGSSGLSIQTFMPTIADPFVALAENRDWTGKPIYRE